MEYYTFRIPEPGVPGPALQFKVPANGIDHAVEKAKSLLDEQTDHDGFIPVEMTFGLTGGRLQVNPEQISRDSVVDIKPIPDDF